MAAIIPAHDTIRFTSLGAEVPVTYKVHDDRNRLVLDTAADITVNDSGVIAVAGDLLRSEAPGLTELRLGVGSVVATVVVQVRQRVTSLRLPRDTFSFDALNDTALAQPVALDSLGSPVAQPLVISALSDSQVARFESGLTLRSISQGLSFVTVWDAETGVADTALVSVWQSPVETGATLVEMDGFSFARGGDSIGEVWAKDRNAYRLPHSRMQVGVTDTARVSVDTLGVVRAKRSGVTHLSVNVDSLSFDTSLAVVLPVEVHEPQISAFQVLGMPDTMAVGPPTALLMPDGTTRLFFTGYSPDSLMNPPFSGDLHYATSTDGIHFVYAGIALKRDSSFSGLRSQGVENVFIVPRDDGPGCRMYAAAGATWWIWQVFSAISDDCDQWTWEDGPAVPGVVESAHVRRGTGEGIHVWQDSAGTWWMLMGAHSLEAQDDRVWTVGLYRGATQRQWEFVRTIFRPGPAGFGRDRAVFSPSIVEIAPGLYRMFFAGDNYTFDPVGGNSRIWSAVSRDRFNWTFEGVALDFGLTFGGPSYPTVIGDKLYVQVRAPSSLGGVYLSAARISQP